MHGSTISRTFAALKYPNYRLWFMGQLASLVGTWMQSTAQAFLVYQITGNDPAYLGYVGFAAGVPTWLFMLFAGVVADRMSRRTLMIFTQTAMMILAFVLAGLTFLGIVQPWHVIVLAFLLGVANAFDAPARQAFVLEMVEREDLANAIALNSTMFQSATVVGPAVAGITYAVLGPAWCFTINGISFLAVIAALLAMKLKRQPPLPSHSVLHDLTEGLVYTWRHPMIRTLIGLAGAGSLFGLAFVTLFPDWTVSVLHGNADVNGYLQSARGLGALLGALMIASLGRIHFKGKLLTLGAFVFPVGTLLFAFTRTLPLSLLTLIVVGWGFMIVFNMANTLIQHEVSDQLRGRVMAVYTLTFFGFMPLGALWAGIAAARIGAPAAISVGAIISLFLAVLLFFLAPGLRAMK